MEVKRTERGWPGHYICAPDCLFRRNTLLECGEKKVIVSTVGSCIRNGKMEQIGYQRYYETMAFEAVEKNGYVDAVVSNTVDFESKWAINADHVTDLSPDVDNEANDMHEAVVAEITETLKAEVPE